MKTIKESDTIFCTGCAPDEATLGFIMLHGRGSDASDMRSVLPDLFARTAYALMPQAPLEIMPGRFAWYPHFWNENLEENLKYLHKSFEKIDLCIDHMHRVGIKDEQIVFISHSQGANLSLEYYLTHPRPYKAVISMRGCVLGNFNDERDFNDELKSTLISLNAGRKDPYIPMKKIEQSYDILKRLGADKVIKKQYETGHGICRTELMDLRRLIKKDFALPEN